MGVLLNWWREILLTALSAGASNFSSMSVCGRRIPRSRILSRRPVSRCSARGPYVCYNLHRGTCDWKKKRPEPVHQRINLFQVLHLLYAKLRSSVNAPVHRITSTLQPTTLILISTITLKEYFSMVNYNDFLYFITKMNHLLKIRHLY